MKIVQAPEIFVNPEILEQMIEKGDVPVAFAHRLEEKDMEKRVNMNPEFAEVNAELKEMSMDPQSRLAYEKRLDQVLFRRIELRKMREKGEEIGMKKGEKIGVKKGEEIGLKKRNLEIATHMRDEGVAPELIRKFTGFSLEDM